MKKNVTKILTVTILTISIATTAFAKTFSYGGMTAQSKIMPEWHFGANARDYCTMRTDNISGQTFSDKKVTTYGESFGNSGKLTGFDTGYSWAAVNLADIYVTQFNSTHSIANANNVYSTYKSVTESDSQDPWE